MSTGRASTCSAAAYETRRETMPAALAASAAMAETSRSAGASVRLLERLVRQAGDGGQRSLQFVHDAGDQPSHGRHLLGAEELLLHGPLIEQADRHADLIAEVLRQGLLVGGEIADPVVLVQFQHADDFALGDHRHEQQALRRTIPGLGGHRERAAVDIGNHQQGAVMETGHGARRGSAGRRRERNRFRFHAVFLNRIERLGGAIVDVKLHPRDPDNAGQRFRDALQNGRRARKRRESPRPACRCAAAAAAAPANGVRGSTGRNPPAG